MLKKQQLNKATTKNRGRTLVLERMFKASRPALFKAYTDPAMLKQWWGPNGWALDYCEVDASPGGAWHYSLKCVDETKEYFGTVSWGKAVYESIEAPISIKYVEYFSNESGELAAPMSTVLITVKFIEEKGKTKVVNEIDFADKAGLQKMLNMGLVLGLSEGWGKLERLLEK